MAILTIQRQLRELGRIRLGQKGDRGQPVKLSSFRLTSPSRDLLEQAQAVYGGELRPWADAPGGAQWDLVTATDVLDVLVPPGDHVLSQWFELWSAAGCQRRCDGYRNVLTDGPCECPDDPSDRQEAAKKGRACRPTTRLRLMLPRIPDVGVWTLESHGFYAAAELPGTVDVCRLATERGVMLPAQLRLHKRERKVPGEGTRRYVVPVLELPQVTTQQLTAGDAPGSSVPAVGGGARRRALPDGDSVRGAVGATASSAEVEAAESRGKGHNDRQTAVPVDEGAVEAAPVVGDPGSAVADTPRSPDPTRPTASGGSAGRRMPSSRGGSGRSGGPAARDDLEARPSADAAAASQDRATGAQVRYVMKLARDRFGADAEARVKADAGIESFSELTKYGANALIDRLRDEPPPEAVGMDAAVENVVAGFPGAEVAE